MSFKKYLYKIGYPIARTYWFFVRPKTRGVKCIVQHGDQILLIRNPYTRPGEWTLPGGGVQKNETQEQAVIREVEEEVGLKVSDLKFLDELITTHQYKQDTVYCFSAEVANTDFVLNHNEIEEARWFPRKDLPSTISPFTFRVLQLAKN